MDGTEYKLLDRCTPDLGPIFWVADEAKAHDNDFINKILTAELKAVSETFNMAMATADESCMRSRIKWVPTPGGGCEVHIDHTNPGVTVRDGKTVVTGVALERLKAIAQKAQDLSEKQNKKGCFIATAACGTAAMPAVATLRDFRDSVMVRHRFGRYLVDLYATIAPPIAFWIEPRYSARWLVRNFLVLPLAWLVRRVVESDES